MEDGARRPGSFGLILAHGATVLSYPLRSKSSTARHARQSCQQAPQGAINLFGMPEQLPATTHALLVNVWSENGRPSKLVLAYENVGEVGANGHVLEILETREMPIRETYTRTPQHTPQQKVGLVGVVCECWEHI